MSKECWLQFYCFNKLQNGLGASLFPSKETDDFSSIHVQDDDFHFKHHFIKCYAKVRWLTFYLQLDLKSLFRIYKQLQNLIVQKKSLFIRCGKLSFEWCSPKRWNKFLLKAFQHCTKLRISFFSKSYFQALSTSFRSNWNNILSLTSVHVSSGWIGRKYFDNHSHFNKF